MTGSTDVLHCVLWVSAVILAEIIFKLFSFPFFSRGGLYLTISKMHKDMNLGALSKILTESSSTNSDLLMPLSKHQCLTYVYSRYDTVKGAEGRIWQIH